MSYQRRFRSGKEFAIGIRTFGLYRVCCILYFVSLFYASTPSMAASDGWAATYGGVSFDEAYYIQQTNDGGYIVAGVTDSFGAGGGDIWVLKLRPNGAVEWQKTYGGDSWDEARSVQQTNDGGYVVAGETFSFGARKGDALVLKLSPDGTVEWQKTYGGVDDDLAFFIQQTSDEGFIVAGNTSSFSAGEEDFWVLKLRPDGSIDPSCHFIRAAGLSEKNSSTSVRTTNADASNSNVNPQDSSVTIQDTKVSVNFLCSSTAAE